VRILITGGAGFIGSHVADAYIAAGHEVAVLDNFSTGNERNLNANAEVHRVDVRDGEAVQKAISSFGPQLVNHHAAQAEVPKSVADPVFDATVNIVGGLNLLKACVDNQVEKVIFSSTGGALYGEGVAQRVWALALAATGRFMFPNVLNEPPQQFKVGFPNEYGMGVDERWKEKYGIWLIRTAEDIDQHVSGFYVLISVCTHLGCRLALDAAARQLNCPCHTTSFAVSGELLRHQLPVAPRPLPQLQVRELHGDVQVYAPPGPTA